MTTEIELPPLPEPTGIKVGQSHAYMHTHNAMYAYARAAVLADREKRAPQDWSNPPASIMKRLAEQVRAEPVDAQPVAWRWKHIKDDRWYYGKLPKHLQPRPGVKLPNHLVEPLYAAPPSTRELVDAREQGRREGLLEAARLCEALKRDVPGENPESFAASLNSELMRASYAIRALIEKQKEQSK
jgi:hypothetical protein